MAALLVRKLKLRISMFVLTAPVSPTIESIPQVFRVLEPRFIKADIGSTITSLDKNNITLKCRAKGVPQPQITWYKDGEIIQNGGETLSISSVEQIDSGQYSCKAANSLGSFTETASDINIIGE